VPLVASHQIIGTGGVGTLNEYIIAWVGRHLKRTGRFHETGPLLDQIDDLPLNALADSEFRTGQNVQVFRQDVSGNVQPRGFGEG
jgi:hypothetical protein